LLLIDGVAVASGANASALAGLAPRDVARIDVLKDASATGLYGSRGANGVIIITTKRAPVAEPIHDTTRAQPPVVDPGPVAPSAPVPSDAVVLFDGRDLSQWKSRDGGPPGWKIENGYMEVVAGAGGIATIRAFGDCQLHIEWAAPAAPAGAGQDRGNSGVFLMGMYEVQVLDSYRNVTYPDGQAAAIYGQYPPLVNASRPPGEWQSYDIVFRRPRFSERGELIAPARITVLHNGVLVHDAVTLTGPTAHRRRPAYSAHPDRLPIALQDHASPVRFRNIWVRDLER
jgi:TonB-dependent SusC/RagA subfamily outer membrane receptor